MNHLDTLPLELVFTVVGYLVDRRDINKLIDSSDILRDTFKLDVNWKKLFYQNIIGPIINPNNLWRDNFYDNLNQIDKYQISQDSDVEYNYIIIKFDNLGMLYTSKMELLKYSIPRLSYIKDKNGFAYKNPDHQDLIDSLSHFTYRNLDNSIGIETSDDWDIGVEISKIISSLGITWTDLEDASVLTLTIGKYIINYVDFSKH